MADYPENTLTEGVLLEYSAVTALQTPAPTRDAKNFDRMPSENLRLICNTDNEQLHGTNYVELMVAVRDSYFIVEYDWILQNDQTPPVNTDKKYVKEVTSVVRALIHKLITNGFPG